MILKLKTKGEKSPQFQTFKNSIDSFHFNQSPKGIHQTNMLQNILKFSDARGTCILKASAWFVNLDRMLLKQVHPIGFLYDMSLHEKYGEFPIFL